MKNQMWSGRFSTESSELLKEFNASLNFDKILYKHDIQGSIAHATMLEKCGIITQSELDSLVAGLKAVQSEIEQGKFSFDIRDEDIHMAVERRLSELVGEVGGKLHTARSRNDQVATDFKLYVKAGSHGNRPLLLIDERSADWRFHSHSPCIHSSEVSLPSGNYFPHP